MTDDNSADDDSIYDHCPDCGGVLPPTGGHTWCDYDPDDDATDECNHDAAQVEHQGKHGTEVEFWIACADCGGHWTLTGDLARETAHISREEGA